MLCVLPWCDKEFAQELRLLLWMHELGGCKDHEALMVLGSSVSQKEQSEMVDLAKRVFGKVDVIRAFYEDPRPWPVNANLMFQRAARHVAESVKKPWFWCEPDCVPLVPGWLDKWEAEYKACGKPYMGFIVKEPPHLTGCAVYPPDISIYSPHPLLCEQVAFDVVDVGKIIPNAHHTKLYHHQWFYGVPPQPANSYSSAATTFKTVNDLNIISPSAVLFHRNKDGTLIERLRERMKNPVRVEAPKIAPQIASEVASQKAAKPSEEVPGKTKYKMSILVRTWHQDSPWLPYSLRSIQKFTSGFERVLVVAQENDEPIIRPICAECGVEYRSVENDTCDGYIAQQITKMKADEYLPEADFILHHDSDTLFMLESKPKHFISAPFGHRAIILMQDYATLDGSVPWQKPTEMALGSPVQYEFMRRHPLVYPRWLYKEAREFLTRRFGMPWDKWLSEQVGETKGFSEFNFLGAFAFQYFHDKFRWVDVKKKQIGPDHCYQFWSWAGMNDDAKRKIDEILK